MLLNETYIKVYTNKKLSDAFPIQIGLKQGDASSPFVFNFATEYHQGGPTKSGRPGIEWNTSVLGLCW